MTAALDRARVANRAALLADPDLAAVLTVSADVVVTPTGPDWELTADVVFRAPVGAHRLAVSLRSWADDIDASEDAR